MCSNQAGMCIVHKLKLYITIVQCSALYNLNSVYSTQKKLGDHERSDKRQHKRLVNAALTIPVIENFYPELLVKYVTFINQFSVNIDK